jgi:hypothetical protein
MSPAARSPRIPETLHARFSGMARAGQVISSLAVVVLAYWLYWLIAVPLIEPSVEQEPVARTSEKDIQKAKEAGHSRTLAVSKYFAEGRWELKDPAIWESDQTQLLFKSLQPQPDGKVQLNPCTVLFFPKDRDATTQPIIMQADNGALMEFDAPIVIKSVNMRERQLVGGHLKGPVTIRRKESRAGARDDLEIDTRDITLIKDRLGTPHPVQFRFGRNRGTGREMEILLATQDGSAARGGVHGGTMRSLELKHDVKMQLELGAGPLAAGKPNQPEPPIQITCQKSFRYDMQRHAASFYDQVDVLRLNPIGPADQLNCDVLTVFFEPHGAKPAAVDRAVPAGSEDQLSGLQVRVIEARGDPVTLRSPAQGAYVHCRGIDYYPAPSGATGRMMALGPGVMTGNMPKDPANTYKVAWTREFRFEPAGAQQVASLRGGARVRFDQMGEIAAEEIFAWLSPKPQPPGNRGPAVKTVSTRPDSAAVGPAPTSNGWQLDRVLAQGNVIVDSPQLRGATAKLEAWIERPQASSALPEDDPRQAPSPAEPPAAQQRQPEQTSTQRYGVRGGLVRVKLVPNGQQMTVSDVTVEQQARLEEISAPRGNEKPLLVEGDRLHVTDANSDATHVTVTGRPGYLEAGGMTLRGEAIEMEKQTNRLWIDGPGRMAMPIEQDMSGQPIARPQNLNITWHKGMNFQSNTVVYLGGVLAKSDSQSLRTEKLEAILSRPVDFSTAKGPKGGRPDERPQLAHLRCYGPGFLESREFDERGQQTRFNQWEGIDLEFDKISGAIKARGPGWVTNVSRGSDQPGLSRSGQSDKPRATDLPNESATDELKYLNVQFQRSMVGNLNRREMTFGEPTKATYGPVPHWEARLNPDEPANLGPQGLVLDARTITVRQMPARGRDGLAWMELEAIGNVLAENSQFTARGDRLSYSEEKDQVILRGDVRSPAELFQEDENGGPRKEFKGGELKYWLKLQNVLVNGVQSFGSSFLQAPKKKPASK